MYELTPKLLAEIEELKGTGLERVSTHLSSNSVHQVSKTSLPQLVRRNARVNPMALSHISLHQATYLYPHLFLHL